MEHAQPQALLTALTPHHAPDNTGAWMDDRFMLVQASTFNTPESHDEVLPYQCPRTGRLIAAWARLDNRTELQQALRLDTQTESLTDPALIMAAFNVWGADCINRLEGDFAFVILDPHRGEVFAGRDTLGIKPLYYFLDEQLFAFATSAAPLRRIAGVDTAIDEGWLVRHITQLSTSFNRTAMDRIYKLPPAHHFHVTGTNERLKRYHQFIDDAPWSTQRSPIWVEKYRHCLDTVARDRLRTQYTIGCESSGGLDSSSVLAVIARNNLTNNHLHTFSFAHCTDEPEHILSTSQHLGIHINHVITSRRVLDDTIIDRTLDVQGLPPELGFGVTYAPVYELCRHLNIRTLFSGFGGDEVVTNTGHLLLTELWRHRAWGALWRSSPGIWPVRGVHLIRQWQHHRRPQLHNSRSLHAYSSRLKQSILHSSAITHYHLQDLANEHSRYDAGHSSINRFILDDRLNAFMPTRLESCTLMAASHGVEYRWPLLDRRLIQQYLSTPAIEKFDQGGRHLHRRAMIDALPNSVLWKPKSMGAVLPSTMNFEVEQNNLAQLIRPNNLHPILKPIIDIDRLKSALVAKPGTLSGGRRHELRHVASIQRWLERFY